MVRPADFWLESTDSLWDAFAKRLNRSRLPTFFGSYVVWQHLEPGTQLHDGPGLALMLDQLQGFEAPAAAWETFLFPARLAEYQPEFLDRLCLSGRFLWGRANPPDLGTLVPQGSTPGRDTRVGRSVRPTRIAPIAFFERSHISHFRFLAASPATLKAGRRAHLRFRLSHPAREVFAYLDRRGASFMEDLVQGTGRLPVEVQDGLWELVTAGLVTGDAFDNLRALIDPKRRRDGSALSPLRHRHPKRSLKRKHRFQPAPMGRWSLLNNDDSGSHNPQRDPEMDLEFFAQQLLKRWGVVFRDLLARENLAPSWRDLLRIYRCMESRGEIRGGRFVTGFTGEQFSLPEALDALRSLRHQAPNGQTIRISAADPLNLQGSSFRGNGCGLIQRAFSISATASRSKTQRPVISVESQRILGPERDDNGNLVLVGQPGGPGTAIVATVCVWPHIARHRTG